MNQVSVASTLSGKIAVMHPKHCVLCRDDGAVLISKAGRFVHYKPYEIPHKWGFGSTNAKGYRLTSIGGRLYSVHRLICEAFHDNPENKPTVDHINRVRDDNRASNLRWATAKEQRDNSSAIITRLPYSVRWCKNRSVYGKEYRADHLEENREYSKTYYENHREQLKARSRKYYAEHSEYIKAMAARRRSKHKAKA